jgi:hypothetical protein
LTIGGFNSTSPPILILKLSRFLVSPASRYPGLLILIGQIGKFPCEFNNAITTPQATVTDFKVEINLTSVIGFVASANSFLTHRATENFTPWAAMEI